MVIGASWISRIGEKDGTVNIRGVSTVLALANFLKRKSLLILLSFTVLLTFPFLNRVFLLGERHRICHKRWVPGGNASMAGRIS